MADGAQHDLGEALGRLGAVPVALWFAGHLDPTDRFVAGLDHPVDTGLVRQLRGAAHRVDDAGDQRLAATSS